MDTRTESCMDYALQGTGMTSNKAKFTQYLQIVDYVERGNSSSQSDLIIPFTQAVVMV